MSALSQTSNLSSEPNIAAVARLLGDPTRAAMCLALIDGLALPAGELARQARVSPQTASNHLEKLRRGRIVLIEQQGRWRYYRLNGEEVAHAIETLAVIAPADRQSTAAENPIPDPLRLARTCYKHFAGKLGVALADALLRERWIEPSEHHPRDFHVTDEGGRRLVELGIDLTALQKGQRALAYRCLDWSERRHHIAGPLGSALVQLAFDRRWVCRLKGTRAVMILPKGRSELRRLLDVRC